MNRIKGPACKLVLSIAALFSIPCAVRAAVLTPYHDEAAFQAAIGPGFTVETFDGFASGTVITTQVLRVSFSSPNDGGASYVAIAATFSNGAASAPNMLTGGYLSGSPEVDQIIVMDYSPSIFAVGFFLAPQAPDASAVTIRFDFIDGGSQTYLVADTDGNGSTHEFLGVKADTRFLRATLISGKDNQGQGGFSKFGIDNLTIAEVEQRAPECSAAPVEQAGVRGINGSATDSAPFDSGIESITLTGAANVTLTCDAPFPSTCGSIPTPAPSGSWRTTATDPRVDGQGTVVATDAAGNSCSVPVTFRAVPAGPVEGQVLCLGPGLLFQATNQNATAAEESACSATPYGPGEPGLPPGYEPSPLVDPSPCQIFTIDSPVSGLTEMVYKKDGTFEPRLRILFSRFDGMSFPPFTDITETVEEIATVTPDPTRLKGAGNWSLVKVACAVQSEICNGLDDDGDGLIDEGLPADNPEIDFDDDGYALCPADPSLADCNDQISRINPGALEACNGLDDDCDAAVDEGGPAGGEACDVAGLLGACSVGSTSCAVGPMTCVQTVYPAESDSVCNGVDDDCDGLTDEEFAPGATTCGVGVCGAEGTSSCEDGVLLDSCVPGEPSGEVCDALDNDCDGAADEDLGTTSCGVGECRRTVDNCVGGVSQTCAPGSPAAEVCDSRDNDCDGVTDEAYTFGGYLQPVNQDGSSIFKFKSTVPLKFQLKGCNGGSITTAVATLELIPYTNSVVGTVMENVPAGLQASSGNTFVYDAKTKQYLYNLSTKTLLPGTSYIVRTHLDDGSDHDVIISIR